MEKFMFYTIYKITNQINGKHYIGSHKTRDLNDNYMGSGKYLKHAIGKYGEQNFTKEIMFVFDTPEEMYLKEGEIVNEDFLTTENTYNLKTGGFGGFDYINSNNMRSYSKERANKISSKLKEYHADPIIKEKNNKLLNENRIKATLEIKRKYPNGTFVNKKHTDETKEKIGKTNTIKQNGEKNSQYGTIWITDGTNNLKIKKDCDIPIGWKLGRVIKKQ
jgi:group I intron endonuclease